jgi:short-subunit dehydrogenase
MNYESPTGVAVVTGASSGIGAIYADRLAKRGFCLIVVARDEARLQALSERLAKDTGRAVTPLRADLTNSTDVAKVEQVLREDDAITMLVVMSAEDMVDAALVRLD